MKLLLVRGHSSFDLHVMEECMTNSRPNGIIVRTIALSTAFLLVAGCGAQKEIDKLHAQIDDLEKQSDKWREEVSSLQASAKEVAEKMVVAADSVDPVAVKEIFRKYENLAATNEALKAQIALSIGRQGDINLTSDSLRVAIKRYSGALILDGWIEESETGKFFDGVRLDQRSFAITLSNLAGSWVSNCLHNPNCANNSHEWLGKIAIDSRLSELHSNYQSELNEKFSAFLLNGPHTTPTDGSEAFIEGRLLRKGKHRLMFKVKPLAEVWSVVLEVGTVGSDKVFKRFHEIHMSNVHGQLESSPVVFYARFDNEASVVPDSNSISSPH